jgi:hypothetical protein
VTNLFAKSTSRCHISFINFVKSVVTKSVVTKSVVTKSVVTKSVEKERDIYLSIIF